MNFIGAGFIFFFLLNQGRGISQVLHDGNIHGGLHAPNIILIVIDDLGYGDLGIFGNKDHQTPNMDRLGKEGILFTDFHANAPVCSPTRAALMTGQYQQRSEVEHAIGFTLKEGLPLHKTTVAERLQSSGYSTAVFGKWHLGHVTRFEPNDQGFSQSCVSNNTPDYHSHVSREGERDWYKNQVLLEESGYLTDLVNDYSIRFIEESSETPFFLFISHLAVHFPFQGPNDPIHRTLGKTWHDSKFGPLPESQYRRAYKDMLEAVDASIGQVIEKLEDLGLREKTLIFITSDNGAYSWVGSNFPYSGQKGDLLEGGHRVPAIANWPGKIEAGRITSETSMTMDLAPTFLSLSGLNFINDNDMDGVDLGPVLFQNEKLIPRQLFWRFNNPYEDSKAFAVRDGDWKYHVVNGERFLFHLNLDPLEKTNLIHVYPDKAECLERDYDKWLAEIEKEL
ncbi:sulfatase-like hydrolase/transferase [Cyclobacterium xiamenense]|uniref:sulfatase-like hydrolase/transferase n=1 Tax=Cyclobacterium xiamenense TaxID=1297121 RepID=UPI0035CED1FD